MQRAIVARSTRGLRHRSLSRRCSRTSAPRGDRGAGARFDSSHRAWACERRRGPAPPRRQGVRREAAQLRRRTSPRERSLAPGLLVTPAARHRERYLGLWSKLEYVDVWYSIPQDVTQRAEASQLWHRDFDDQHLLKAFLYLVDVDERRARSNTSGASSPGGTLRTPWQWRRSAGGSPARRSNAVPADAIKTFTAPKGTVIFCNTSGLHRGGFSDGQPARACDRDLLLTGVARPR